MAKHKLQQFAEVATFKNVIHFVQTGYPVPDLPMKGNWNKDFFIKAQPIIIELGCGKGEYTVGLAERNPSTNYIGLDLKGNRIWRGAKTALESDMSNVGFVRTRIENLEHIFAEGEVDEIWITFPDPQPTEKREKRRLTAPRFVEMYKKILKPGGLIHLKTDNAPFYEYTLEQVKEQGYNLITSTADLYAAQNNEYITQRPELREIKTYYEKKFSAQGFKICYCCFKINPVI